ncbi:MAG: hypothetical protein DBP02_16945 [gamma proteobacterium symbiont of Ctena orbiculata]|nr:MAG: hypothetical protein DBP02_16945 [gamma proteobacterium symbiont of Ctena orbiculata]
MAIICGDSRSFAAFYFKQAIFTIRFSGVGCGLPHRTVQFAQTEKLIFSLISSTSAMLSLNTMDLREIR